MTEEMDKGTRASGTMALREEIIIDGGRIAGITTLKNEIDRLEQENKELKEENFNWEQINKLQEKYKTALEEINRTLLGVHGLSINCDKQIIKVKAIVKEVLNA